MPIVDLSKKLVVGDELILYVNSQMELVQFFYENITYIIDIYQMKEDCYIITCQDTIFMLPINLTLHKLE